MELLSAPSSATKSSLSPSLHFQQVLFPDEFGSCQVGLGARQGNLCLHTFHPLHAGMGMGAGRAFPGILPAVTAARTHPVFPPVPLVLPQNPRRECPKGLALKWDVRWSFASPEAELAGMGCFLPLDRVDVYGELSQ